MNKMKGWMSYVRRCLALIVLAVPGLALSHPGCTGGNNGSVMGLVQVGGGGCGGVTETYAIVCVGPATSVWIRISVIRQPECAILA